MSAVLTKKLGGDYATQLTFPAVFEQQARANHLASQYYPEGASRPMVIEKGSGLQEDYHEQKRLDAIRRCLNGVKDKAAATARFLKSHANYYGMPKPVLGQRIYANPSNGNQADIYSNRPVFHQQMRGGVLRTEEGQKWAIGKLRERIPQLNAIKAAKDAFILGIPEQAIGVESVGITDITTKVELYGLLNRVESDVEQGVVNNKTVERSQNLLKLLFAWTPYGEPNEISEVMDKLEYIQQALKGISEEFEEGVGQSAVGAAMEKNVDYLSNLYDKMAEYLKRMNSVLGRPRKEREKISSTFIKSIGFSELEKKLPALSAKIRREIAAAEASNPNANPEPEEMVEEEEEEEEFAPSMAASAESAYRTSGSLSSFGDRVGPYRPPTFESEEFREEFDRDQRQRFGEQSGAYLGEAAPEEKAARSNMESAQMAEQEVRQVAPVFEMGEELARRQGKMPAAESFVAEVSAPVMAPSKGPAVSEKKKGPLIKKKPSVGARLSDEEEAKLQQYKAIIANLPPWINEHSLDSDKLEETKALAKQNGLYKGNARGAELRRAMKNKFPAIALIPLVRELEKKKSNP